jgi:CheY-like chemotaxis protein/HPt (histidine-containing phosphotransfer) domain-containing protein
VEVTVSKNGRNLDDLVSSAARLGRPFDVVLLDHTLPDATTEDLLRAIRLDSTAPDTYVALLSAFDFEPRQVGDRAVRPDVCIPKPVRQRQLRDVLCTARAARDGTTGTFDVPVLPKVAPAPGLGLHVLVADDNSINRDVASAMLELLACRTVVVGNGQEAVEAARATRFDVILMDCQMPVMDGYAATAAIRREQGTREAVPPHIVALTANALTRDRERCLAAGMDSFLAKPFTQAQLVRLLQPIAEARGTLLPAQAVDADVPAAAEPAATNPAVSSGARSAAPAAPEDLSSTATLTLLDTQILRAPAAPAAKVLDGEQVQSIRGLGQPQLFERLCAMLFETGPQSVHTIRAALDAGDLAAAAAATHSLKSSVSNLGGRRLAEQLDALEETIRERNEVRAARGIASGLEQSYAQFEQALRDETRRSTGT